jgi:hypothetical protein
MFSIPRPRPVGWSAGGSARCRGPRSRCRRLGDRRPAQLAPFERWDGPVVPEQIAPGHPGMGPLDASQRGERGSQLDRPVARRDEDVDLRFHRVPRSLDAVGGFDFWRDLPSDHFRATRRRCQRRTVDGVTSRWPRSPRGRCRTSAASTARSAQHGRGLGLVLRRMATSWRSTSSSMSLDDARLSSVSQLRSRMKIR